MKIPSIPLAGVFVKACAVSLVLAATLAPRPAQAVVTIFADDSGPGVVFSWAASTLDLSALTDIGSWGPDPGGEASVLPSSGIFQSIPAGAGGGRFLLPTTLTAFGSGSLSSGGTASGFSFLLSGLELRLGPGPTAAPAQAISPGSLTFDAPASFASLGVTPTDVTLISWGSGANADSVVMTFTIPEPSTALLSLAAFAALCLRRRRS